MADNNKEKSDREEKKIPVFTVLKKGNIIKNIFLLDNPLPLISEPKSIESEENCKKSNNHNDDLEEILLLGRHPDCTLMLEHPSISRFHLRIYLQTSSQKLSVIDLSSAHGTWVSDRKIEPQVRVELSEGETLRLGASTRIYRLHWIPMSQVFDVENPLISSILENPLPFESKEDAYDDDNETYQNENQIPLLREPKEIPSAPPMPENMNDLFINDDEEKERETLFTDPMLEEKENQSPLRRLDQRDSLSIWSRQMETESVNSSLFPVERVPLDKENQENPQDGFAIRGVPSPSERENQKSPPTKSKKKSDAPSLWSRRGKPASLLRVQTGRSREKKMEVGIEAENQNEIKGEMVSRILFCSSDGEEEVYTSDKENCTPKTVLQPNEIKGETVSKILFCHLEGQEEIYTPNKENCTAKTVLGSKSMKKGRVEEIKPPNSGSLYSKATVDSSSDQEEGMVIYSEKENLTPIFFQDSNSKKPASGRSRLRLETEMIMNKRRVGRVPFQTLVANSIGKSNGDASDLKATTTKSSNSVNCSPTIEENSVPSSNQSVDREANGGRWWNIVVDTSCLLNKESRKSLQLLQGLKGTHLIIPRMVIRELDCLKRRGGLFRKATEISSILQWIEECMVKTKWWIHVQSSLEEGILTAPTPPASPRSQLTSVPFSVCGNLMEIVSPTAQDHILDCALLFKRIKNDDGKLILLTNDVSLKIKAMAEGLLCETAEEFRESLVNPLSERFLWRESTPRGSTWSCLDEAGLREYYKHFPVKKTVKAAEGVKGLKLILLHRQCYLRPLTSKN